jgi:UDP-galactose transporter B1
MARQKQKTPIQRATSSELMHTLPDDASQTRNQNGDAKALAAATQSTTADSEAHGAADTPGLMQLAICVLGIYASLYV